VRVRERECVILRLRERERETSASWKRMGLMALMQYMRAEGRPFWHRTLSRIQDARHRRGESIYRNSRHCQREEMAIMVPTIFAAFFIPQVSLLIFVIMSINISYYVQKPIMCFKNPLRCNSS
jgi:hypothetical protein